MKKVLTILLLSSLFISFVACGQAEKINPTDMNTGAKESQELNTALDDNSAKDEAQNSEKANESSKQSDTYKEAGETTKEAEPKAKNEASSNTGIIAKSDNVVVSQDKEEILKDLDAKLDALFSSMNELEDLQDSDLE